ncbi:glycerophosphodiester phosphodiesterase family protein [Paucibacter sp. Y2R2-4]|uniref:glycerophosphodiester phosphodiesterase family protein n=1 Tax=Paucibacter sp. Y2R2-4 TaxID=2893553 RepID=UPI0021E40BF8|nr:glycerophosphodiester phosphodiesterase family protein [Paucibacter sp. Y2R2-4]MCV2351197.1 PEP-CTERM sorting domain-containing protein [Paucibacter sp. Y2R2-4]
MLNSYRMAAVAAVCAGFALAGTAQAQADIYGARPQALPAKVWNTLTGDAPVVIGHRGASGYRPEHTLASYELAIAQGANYIEPDLVMTKDGELIARHEPLLARVDLNADGSIKMVNGAPVLNRTDSSTNVWQLDKYADRLKVKTLDGQKVAGWFAEDFTAAEIRSDIRAQERLRDLRLGNNAYNDKLVIPTLQEVIDLAKAKSLETGRTIGIYPETKHPTYFKNFTDATGLKRMEDKLVEVLHANYGNDRNAPVFIQSFEVHNLEYINSKTDIKIVQLLNGSGTPFDDARSYADLASAAGLDFIKGYADGVGSNTNLMITLVGGKLGSPTQLIANAHQRGLAVHGWTFRAENVFLPNEFDSSADPAAFGDLAGQVKAFVDLGMDGFFTDQPDLGVAAVAALAVPEPQTYALMLGGLAGVLAMARRRKSSQAA